MMTSRRRKRYAAVLLLVLLTTGVAVLSGCAGSASTPDQSKTEETQKSAPETKPEETTTTEAQGESKVYKVTLIGASPSGLWSLIGEGINNALAQAYPGSAVTYETSGGGLANIPIVVRGDVELGIVHNAEVKAALAGKDPYDEPITDLYALGYIYNWSPFQYVIRRDVAEKYGIDTLDDIVKKQVPLKVGVNQAGNITYAMNSDIFSLYGMPFEDVKKWGGQIVLAPSGEASDLMKDRRLDMIANSLFPGHSSLVELGRSVEIKMLPFRSDIVEKINAEWGTDPFTLKAGTYDWVEEDVQTFALGAMILINKDISDDEAYDLAKALVENMESIQGVHKSMQALTPQLLASQKLIPYHPGAARYYREQGLLK